MIYRFRVTYEDHEDVFRDIDIKASQTFEDFHNAIQQAISFDNSKPAVFYTSDDYWRKETEIPVLASGEKAKSSRTSSEKTVKRNVIADFVNGPHQKFIYVFDPAVEWTFQIELIKIFADNGTDYPKCVRSSGNAPKQYKEINISPPSEDDEDDIPKKKKSAKSVLPEEPEDIPADAFEESDTILPNRKELEDEEIPIDDEEGRENLYDFEPDDDNENFRNMKE